MSFRRVSSEAPRPSVKLSVSNDRVFLNISLTAVVAHHVLFLSGYVVVLGFGALFSLITTALVLMDKYFAGGATMSSEQFK